jgi:tetrahydromethanopterin S-methyltransferase subunit G
MGKAMRMKKMNFENEKRVHTVEKSEKSNISLFDKKTKLDQMIDNSNQMSIIINRIESIEKILNNIWNETSDKWVGEIREIKWKYAGIVVDKFFFYLSILYFLLTFFPLIFSMANFYKPQ